MKLALAFDIERSGATSEYETIALGASVVDENFKELDKFIFCNYVPAETKFEPRCWSEFWDKPKNQEVLKTLEYKGTSKTKEERETEMINAFMEFRAKWEKHAKDNGHQLTVYTDNNVYDGGFVNQLMMDRTSKLPLPYTADSQEYDSFFETHSMLRGVLTVADPTFDSDWGLSNRIREIYDVPEMKKSHTHNPADDAYTIAFDAQIVNGIKAGRIRQRYTFMWELEKVGRFLGLMR